MYKVLKKLVLLHDGVMYVKINEKPLSEMCKCCIESQEIIKIGGTDAITFSTLLTLLTKNQLVLFGEQEHVFIESIISEIEAATLNSIFPDLIQDKFLSSNDVLERIFSVDPVIKKCVEMHEEASLNSLSTMVKLATKSKDYTDDMDMGDSTEEESSE